MSEVKISYKTESLPMEAFTIDYFHPSLGSCDITFRRVRRNDVASVCFANSQVGHFYAELNLEEMRELATLISKMAHDMSNDIHAANRPAITAKFEGLNKYV